MLKVFKEEIKNPLKKSLKTQTLEWNEKKNPRFQIEIESENKTQTKVKLENKNLETWTRNSLTKFNTIDGRKNPKHLEKDRTNGYPNQRKQTLKALDIKFPGNLDTMHKTKI